MAPRADSARVTLIGTVKRSLTRQARVREGPLAPPGRVLGGLRRLLVVQNAQRGHRAAGWWVRPRAHRERQAYAAASPDPVSAFSGPVCAHRTMTTPTRRRPSSRASGVSVGAAKVLGIDRLGMDVECSSVASTSTCAARGRARRRAARTSRPGSWSSASSPRLRPRLRRRAATSCRPPGTRRWGACRGDRTDRDG